MIIKNIIFNNQTHILLVHKLTLTTYITLYRMFEMFCWRA